MFHKQEKSVARELPKIYIGRLALCLNPKTLFQPQNPISGGEDAYLPNVCVLPVLTMGESTSICIVAGD